jgi:hypothetical protein
MDKSAIIPVILKKFLIIKITAKIHKKSNQHGFKIQFFNIVKFATLNNLD